MSAVVAQRYFERLLTWRRLPKCHRDKVVDVLHADRAAILARIATYAAHAEELRAQLEADEDALRLLEAAAEEPPCC